MREGHVRRSGVSKGDSASLRHHAAALLAVAALCVSVAGCEASNSSASEPEDFTDIVAAAIAEAKEGGASDAQLALLEGAQARGELSLQDAREAARSAVECVDSAGFDGIYAEETKPSGLVVPWFTSPVDTSEQMAVYDACSQQEYWWVFTVYAMQPTSQALQDAYLEKQVPLVKACLQENGFDVAPDATTIDILRQARDVNSASESAIDCIWKFGIEGF